MYMAHIVFIIASYNLVCVFTMIVAISYMILVTIVTIVAGKYRLLSYQNTYIYKMGKFHKIAIATVMLCMSTELSGHQYSKTMATILIAGLWIEL